MTGIRLGIARRFNCAATALLMRSQDVMHAAREAWQADVRNTQISHFHLQVQLRPAICAFASHTD